MNSNQRIKRYGFTRVLQAAITRRLEQYVNLHLWAILTRPVISHYELPEAHAKNFEFRRLSLEDLLLAADNPELHLSKQFVRNALERGDICVGAFKKKQLIGYTWRSLTRAPITDKLWIRIDSRPQRYGYKALVLEAFRGQRLNKSISEFYDKYFVDLGVTTDVSYVALNNLPSITSSFQNPHRTFRGYAGYWKVGKRYWTFRTKGANQYVKFELSEN